MKRTLRIIAVIAIAFSAAYCAKVSDEWQWRYSYLDQLQASQDTLPQFCPTEEYFLVVLVQAQHADYSSPRAYLATLASSFVKEHSPDPGHAWIVLVGKKDGKLWLFEGGHSANCPHVAADYMSHVLCSSGVDDDPNPARHLFIPTNEGFFEYGSGGSVPTYAAAIPLTEEGFARVLSLFEYNGYDFSRWGIQGPNCVQFVLSCLASVGIECHCDDTISIPPSISLLGKQFLLWTDPSYRLLTINTPDLLEKRLWELVRGHVAYCATQWYSGFKEMCDKGYLDLEGVRTQPRSKVKEQAFDAFSLRTT